MEKRNFRRIYSDSERFCTKVSPFSIFHTDSTYSIRNFYVTVTNYQHLLFDTADRESIQFFWVLVKYILAKSI